MKQVSHKSSGERPPFHQKQISAEQVQELPAEGEQVNQKNSAPKKLSMKWTTTHGNPPFVLRDRIQRLRGREWPQ